MPNRIVKESIRTSDTLSNVSANAERLFWRLVVSADDYGRFDARPSIVLGQCLTAFIDSVSADEINVWLDELEGVGLIERYWVEGRPYLLLEKWDKHQRRRAKDSKFPAPDTKNKHSLSHDNKRGQASSNVVSNENEDENVFGNENGNEFVNDNENGNATDGGIEIQITSHAVATAAEPTEVPKDSSSSYVDEELAQIARTYESEGFGPISATVREQLVFLHQDFGFEWTMLAMKESVLQNKRRISYVGSILQNWRAEGGPRMSDIKSRGAPRSGNSLGSNNRAKQRDERYSAFYELFPNA